MSMQLSQVVANRLNMQPVMLSLAHGPMVASCLMQLAKGNSVDEAQEQMKARADMLSSYGYRSSQHDKPFAYADGIAFIPVTGMLINRFNCSYGYVTGYNFIREQLNAAVEDGDVNLIVFDCNSGGGEVAGCFELCADINASRLSKPSIAVVDSSSYSACYAIASSCTRVVVAPSAGVGSIGVVAMHMNLGKALSDYGVEVTFIYSGDHKVDGNPYEALPEPVIKSIQARVDNTRQEFVSLVASNRALDTKIVFDTQAACFTASEALALGLIDGISPPLEAVQSYLSSITDSTTMKEISMSGTTVVKPGIAATASEAVTVVAAVAAVAVDANTERTAERARVSGILNHASAADKSVLANHLALNTNYSVVEAAAILAVAASEKSATSAQSASAFTAAMEVSEHPNVGADTSAASGEMTAAQRILKSQSLATGIKH